MGHKGGDCQGHMALSDSRQGPWGPRVQIALADHVDIFKNQYIQLTIRTWVAIGLIVTRVHIAFAGVIAIERTGKVVLRLEQTLLGALTR